MILLAALVAAQLVAAAPRSFVVRDAASHRARVPLVASSEGPMLRIESLGEMMPIEVRRVSGTSYTLEVWGASLELETGVAMVRSGADTRPLAAAPRVQDGQLLVPLQLISDVFP